MHLASSVSSTENDINMRPAMAWTAIDRLSIIWKSSQSDKMKRDFFQAAAVSVLLYGCTTWTLKKTYWEKARQKFHKNATKFNIVNKSLKLHSTKQQLYGNLPPISKTIEIRRRRHAGHFWKDKDELISNILPWIPSNGRTSVGQPRRTYLQQLCADTGCSLEDLPGAMDDRHEW